MKNKIFLVFLIFVSFFSISILQASFSEEEQKPLREINRSNVKKIVEEHLKENPDLLNSSKDKDIVVFLGKTGSGKSTLINYISDKDLYVENGCIVLQNPSDPTSMKIGIGANSETLLPKFLRSKDFLFYDLPGFNDTRGAAISLINACFIKNIIENARTARLVFVAGQDELTAGRGELFKQLSNITRNLIPNEIIEDFSALVITKATIGSNKQQLTHYLKTQTDAGTLDCWIDRDKLTRMSFPFNGEINQNDKADILEVIRSINPRKIGSVNISVIYNNQEQNKIKNIYAEEIEENFNILLSSNINVNHLSSLNISSLENKKNYFTNTFFNDLVSSLSKSDLITLLRPFSEDIYTSCWNEVKVNKQIRIQNILEQIEAEKEKQRRIQAEKERQAEEQRRIAAENARRSEEQRRIAAENARRAEEQKRIALENEIRAVEQRRIQEEEVRKRPLPEGNYNLSCQTRNGGLRYLDQIFMFGNVAIPTSRPRVWTLNLIGDNLYRISCDNMCLEAFPRDKVVRSMPISGDQDQNWSINPIGNNLYRISCQTRNGGLRCLEAFPNDGVMRPMPPSGDQDQIWSFTKI